MDEWTLKKFWGKPVWDWLQLISVLAIPVVLAVGGCMFNARQNLHEQQLQDQRDAQAQQIEDDRAAAERKIQEQTAQDEALQAYLDQMSSLLLEKDLLTPKGDSKVQTLARARTLTVLGRLDPQRKTAVMKFLVEAELVQSADEREPILDLSSADLSGTNLTDADLSDANLKAADLHNADLHNADLSGANLWNVNLSGADLSKADMVGKKQLEVIATSLEGATMPNQQIQAGTYPSHEFQPSLSFIVDEGWQMQWEETTDQIYIAAGTNELLFTSPNRVFTMLNSTEPQEVLAPDNTDDWVSWFRKHPDLEVSNPVPVTMRGASGVRIDVSASPKTKTYPRDLCTSSCVPLYPTSGPAIVSYDNQRDRFFILDVGADTLLIDIAAPTAEFDEFLPRAQKMLHTIRWS